MGWLLLLGAALVFGDEDKGPAPGPRPAPAPPPPDRAQALDDGSSLQVLGAAYGRADVTAKVRALAQPNGRLSLTADNATFSDGWQGVKKTLVVVFRYGKGPTQMLIAVEGAHVDLAPPANGLFDGLWQDVQQGVAYGAGEWASQQPWFSNFQGGMQGPAGMPYGYPQAPYPQPYAPQPYPAGPALSAPFAMMQRVR